MSGVTFYMKGVSKSSFNYLNGVIKGAADSESPRPIYVYYKCIDGKFRKSTDLFIKECDWIESDSKRKILQRPEPKVKGSEELTTSLDELAAKLDKYIRDKGIGAKVTVKELEDVMCPPEPVVVDTTPNIEKSFLQLFETYTSDANYSRTLFHLKAFNGFYNYNLDWELITSDFYNQYIHFMTEVYINDTNGEVGLLNSTLTRDTRCIKRVCKDARKFINRVPPDSEDFKRPKTIKKGRRRATISEERLMHLLNFDFTNRELYSKYSSKYQTTIRNILEVRDEYAFRFYSGLRLSDAAKLLPDNVVEDYDEQRRVIKVIEFAQQKTLNGNVVPLNDICLSILSKYEGKKFTALPSFSNSHYNDYCKLMFKIAGFNKKVTMSRMKGEKIVVETKEEWELLTSHSARHSSATHLLDNGADLFEVRDFLGQQSIKTTEIYGEMSREVFNSRILSITNRSHKEIKSVG